MYFSKKHNLLFIASPKTGSISIQAALKKLDPDGVGSYVEVNNKRIDPQDLHQGVMGHARAREIKYALGDEYFNKLNTLAVIRHPYSKLVSSYFFLKKSSILNTFNQKVKKNKFKRFLRSFISALLPKILPFKLWALIYPYRSNASYILDYDGTRIVNHIVRTEHLNQDFKKIMRKLGFDEANIQVGRKNTSKHKTYDYYFNSNWFKEKMYYRMKGDIDLYNQISKELDI